MFKWLGSLLDSQSPPKIAKTVQEPEQSIPQQIMEQDISNILSALITSGRIIPIFIDYKGMKTAGDVMRFVEAHAEKVGALMYLWDNHGQIQISLNIKSLMSIIDGFQFKDKLAVRDELRAILPISAQNALKTNDIGSQIVNLAIANHQELAKHEKMPRSYTVSFDNNKAIIMAVPEH